MTDRKIDRRLEVQNASDDKAVLYIYGKIARSSWFNDVVSSADVKDTLQGTSAKELDVHINSPGGDVFESIAIHNLLKRFDGKVNIYIDGLAASGASLIAMAGDTVIMPPNAMMMIHKAWTYTAGNADELRKTAGDLDKMDIAVKTSYMSRFVGTDEELAKLLQDETWLTAAECKTFGLCDVIESNGEAGEVKNQTAKTSLLVKYGFGNAKLPDDSSNQPDSATLLAKFKR